MDRLQKTRHLSKMFRNILLLGVAVYIAASFYVWHVNLDNTKVSLTHINSILTQGVRTTLKAHELVLRGIGEELLEKGALDDPEKGRELIERMKIIDPGMVGFGLARPDGQLVLVSGFKPGQRLPNLAERDESRESFNEVLESKHLQTGRPYFFEALDNWTVPIRTPIFNIHGELRAVMTAGYKVENASVAWSNNDLPENIQIILMRNDGYLIFSQPLPPGYRAQALEKMYSQPATFITEEDIAALNRQKTFLKIEPFLEDDKPQYFAYNYLPEYSLHIGALTGQDAVVNSWLKLMLVPTLLFIIFLTGGSWVLLLSRQRQASADIEISQLSAWQEAALDGADYSIISTDPQGTIVSFNRAAQNMLGYSAAEVIGKVTPEIIHDKNEVIQRANELSIELGIKIEPSFEVFIAKARQDGADEREWTYIRKDGSTLPVYLSITPMHAGSDEIIGFLGIAVDLSEKKAIQSDLRESETRYRALFDSAGDAIFLMQDDHFIDCNPAALEMFACDRDDIVGHTPQRYSPEFQPDGRLSSEKALGKIKAAFDGKNQFFEWRHLKFDGTSFDAEVSLSNVEILNQPHLLATVRDITERKQFIEELAFNARHDSLTGLPNREFLHESFLIYTADADSKSETTVLMLLDLDRFKEVNDTLGHYIGDQVLKQIGPRLNNIYINDNVIISRLGGDEFALLFNTAKSSEELILFATKIVEVLHEPFLINGLKMGIGASIGVACYPQHGKDSHELLRAADVAMYQAKKMSLGVIIYDREYDNYSTQRLSFANELAHAIEEKQLVLHYQPKIDIASGKMESFEALVRWQHPTQGLLYPDAFIDLVEMSDVIHSFTKAVFEIAVTEKKQLHTLGYCQSVAINLSARNLYDDSCFNALEAALASNNLPVTEVELELTESAVMHDTESALQMLNQYSAKGINIAIDDFGTGYSSLAYLRRLPVSALKIDRTFVMGMTSNTQDSAIVRSTIALAHSLDLKVIAEGVEDEDTLKLLASMECDLAQGYGICRPKPLSELIDWLSV